MGSETLMLERSDPIILIMRHVCATLRHVSQIWHRAAVAGFALRYIRSARFSTAPDLSLTNARHVRAIPWPPGRWRAWRRIDTGHAGPLHSRERARGHVLPRCRGGENVGRGKGCCRCHRGGGGPPASLDTHRRGCHSAAQRTGARRAGRPTRPTGGRVGLIAARWGASNRAARWRQLPPTRRRIRGLRANTITRGSSWALRTPKVAARGRRAQLGAVGGGRGADAVRALWPLWQDLFHSLFSVIATLPTLTRPQIPEDTNADCHLWNGYQVPISKYMCASLHFESTLS